MNNLSFYLKKNNKHRLYQKFFYKNFEEFPYIKKIELSFSTEKNLFKKALAIFSALTLMSYQKIKILNADDKNDNILNCNVDLKKERAFFFLERFLCTSFSFLRKKDIVFKNNSLSLKLDNVYTMKEVEKEYEYLRNLPSFQVKIIFSTKNYHEIKHFLKFLNFTDPN